MKNNLTPFLLLVIFLNLIVLDFFVFSRKSDEKVLSATANACPTACVDLIRGTKSLAKEVVIPISTAGTTTKTDWEGLAGSEISFNKANYPGVKKMYFLANLGTDAQDRKAYARLFDVTHGIGVQGSEITSTATTAMQIKSDALNFFSGDLVVRIQIKGLNGNLVSISNGRIVLSY